MPEASLTNDHMYDIDGVTAGTGGEWPAFISSEGLSSTPEYRVSDVDRPQEHGMFQIGADYMSMRVVDMSIGVESPYGTTQQDIIDELKGVMRPRDIDDEMVLRWRRNGVNTRRLYCRPRRCVITDDEVSYHGIVRADLRFEAGDPRIYDDGLNTVNLVPGSTTGGLAFPHGFAHGFGASVGGVSLVTNQGTVPTPISGRLTATGTITGWTIQNLSTGESFGMTIDMNAGDFIDFDFREKTVFLNGSASRSNKITRPGSRWWLLWPGSSTINFTVNTSSGGSATLAVSYRSAWV